MMRFTTQKRRQPPAIIIVALIDILIVLLIFVMATTTLKQQHPALRLALPESSQAKKSGSQEIPPLVVTIDLNGNLRLGETEGKPVTAERLKEELVAAAAKTTGTDESWNEAMNSGSVTPTTMSPSGDAFAGNTERHPDLRCSAPTVAKITRQPRFSASVCRPRRMRMK